MTQSTVPIFQLAHTSVRQPRVTNEVGYDIYSWGYVPLRAYQSQVIVTGVKVELNQLTIGSIDNVNGNIVNNINVGKYLKICVKIV